MKGAAYAVNSKGLGLGLGPVVLGSRKLLSISGCRKINNCISRFRPLKWNGNIGMGPRAIERQMYMFKLMAASAASASSGSALAQGDDDENIDVENKNIDVGVGVGVGVACLGVGAVMLGIGYHLGYLLSSSNSTTTTGIASSAVVAARVLVVAANIIGTNIASSFLDKLGRKGLLPRSFSRMMNVTVSSRPSGSGDGSFLMNVRTSDDVDTFARIIALKTAGIPQEMAQVLGEETKDLPQSKFDSLLENIRLDEKHKKETKTSWMEKGWVKKGINYFIFVVGCLATVLFMISGESRGGSGGVGPPGF